MAYALSDYHSLRLQYSGIINSYSSAVIGNKNHTIKLKDLVPNLFENTTQDMTPILMTPLLDYFNLINNAINQFYALETALNNSELILNDTDRVLR